MARVQIKGARELQFKIAQLGAAEEAMAFEEIVASAERVKTTAQQNAPYEEGDLVRSIEVVSDREELAANTGTKLFYAPWVHHGTKRIRANPFLFNAFESESPNLLKALKARQAEVVDSVIRRAPRGRR